MTSADNLFDKHRNRRIILHIGFPKTGTTSIQHGLAKARAGLNSNGFHFPESLGKSNQYFLEAYAQNLDRKLSTHTVLGVHSESDLKQFRQKCSAEFLAELQALPDNVKTLILSNEGLAGLSNASEFDRLMSLLNQAGELVKVIAYIRRQDLNAVSNYTTFLKTGGTRRRILLSYLPGTNAYIFFGDKLKLWADQFGKDKICVRIFDRNELLDGDLISDFKDAAGLPEVIDFQSRKIENPSINPAASTFLRGFNERFPRFEKGIRNPARATVIETLEQHFPGSGRLPSRHDVAEYMAQFSESNEYIRREWFPDRTSLFDADYSAYPEEEAQVSNDELIDVFNKVWELGSRNSSQ